MGLIGALSLLRNVSKQFLYAIQCRRQLLWQRALALQQWDQSTKHLLKVLGPTLQLHYLFKFQSLCRFFKSRSEPFEIFRNFLQYTDCIFKSSDACLKLSKITLKLSNYYFYFYDIAMDRN